MSGADTRILHVGNAPESNGGIASVIRSHLARRLPGFAVTSVATHVPRTNVVVRARVWLVALSRIARSHPRGIVHVHLAQRGSLLREGAAVFVARAAGHRTVVTLHGSGLMNAGPVQTAALRLVCGRAHVVHGFADRYAMRFRIPASQWARIPNDVATPERSRPRNGDRPTVVFLGEAGLRKGIDLLAVAWDDELARRARLVIVGGATPEAANSLAALSRRPGVSILGEVPHVQALALLSDAALLVQPSRAEAFPMSVCEAMAAGCAVVGTDVGGLGELLAAAGQPVVATDAEALRSTLVASLSDPDRLRLLRLQALAYARRELATDVVTTRWHRLYSGLSTRPGVAQRVLS
ncbi:glycosyltransferase family 4 protein [Pseudolysinimonas sp.]|uniref:glycosyltransferase family 4 protein n=1 Tax=Pseudolysinimonas sp. TaxID=2680009 RepID=UPI00378323BD